MPKSTGGPSLFGRYLPERQFNFQTTRPAEAGEVKVHVYSRGVRLSDRLGSMVGGVCMVRVGGEYVAATQEGRHWRYDMPEPAEVE